MTNFIKSILNIINTTKQNQTVKPNAKPTPTPTTNDLLETLKEKERERIDEIHRKHEIEHELRVVETREKERIENERKKSAIEKYFNPADYNWTECLLLFKHYNFSEKCVSIGYYPYYGEIFSYTFTSPCKTVVWKKTGPSIWTLKK